MGFLFRKAKRKRALTFKQKKMWLNYGVWTIGWMWYLVMNKESALGKAMMLELLFGVVQIEYIDIITWRK